LSGLVIKQYGLTKGVIRPAKGAKLNTETIKWLWWPKKYLETCW